MSRKQAVALPADDTVESTTPLAKPDQAPALVPKKHRDIPESPEEENPSKWESLVGQSTGDFEFLEVRTLGDLMALQEDREAEWNERVKVWEKQIREVMRKGGSIRIKYLTAGGYPTEREIKPIEIESKGRYIYMRAFCFRTEDERSFRLDRIIELKKE